MKPYLNLYIGYFWLNIGWYWGEPTRIFKVSIGELDDKLISLFSLQIVKMCLSFGVKW